MRNEVDKKWAENRIKRAFALYKKFLETGKLPRGFRTDYELAHDIIKYLGCCELNKQRRGETPMAHPKGGK